ncbi:MAG TPA: hypothetical protein VMS76_15735 [Planctomycetota bacterium]|nr:hypothetical protein [Planctomycetota bacterium]
MRLAIVIGAAAMAGAARVLALVPHLAAEHELEIFAERAGELPGVRRVRPVTELTPRELDHVVFVVENEPGCGFMLPLVRELGGTVALEQWSLARAARAAYAELDRPGLRGTVRAWREGGLAGLSAWRRGQFGELAFNRSAVRFADSFIVPSEELRRRVLVERNAPTPIGVIEPQADAASQACAWTEIFGRFPSPRSARKTLFRLRVQQALERRRRASSAG